AEKLGMVELLERVEEAVLIAVSTLANLAIADQAALGDEGFDQAETAFVVRWPVVAVGKVERVDVPGVRWIAFVDEIDGELVGGAGARAAALAAGEELLFADLLGLGVVGDEDDLDPVVFGAEEGDHPEIEGAADVLLERSHRAG